MCHAQRGDLEEAEHRFQQAQQWLLQHPESATQLASVRERAEQVLLIAKQKQLSSAGELTDAIDQPGTTSTETKPETM